MIVCSATEKSSIDETLKWKRMIEENSEYGADVSIPCLLVQNKSDLISEVDPEEHQTKLYMENFAKTHGFSGFMHTSAK